MCREQEEHKREKMAGKKQNGKKKEKICEKEREKREVLLNGLWSQTERQIHIPALKVPNYTCHLNQELLHICIKGE